MPEQTGEALPVTTTTTTTETVKKNEATTASDQFIAKEKKGFGHLLGTLGRTALTETLTLGALGIPIGLGFGAVFGVGSALFAAGGFSGGAITSAALAGAGLATSVISGIATAIGTAIGWNSAKHTEKGRSWFTAGKLAEFLSIPAEAMLPGIYGVGKAFSIIASGIGIHQRPAKA